MLDLSEAVSRACCTPPLLLCLQIADCAALQRQCACTRPLLMGPARHPLGDFSQAFARPTPWQSSLAVISMPIRLLARVQPDFREEAVVPLPLMPFGEIGRTYVVLGRPEGSLALGKFAATLRFVVKEIDPATGGSSCLQPKCPVSSS